MTATETIRARLEPDLARDVRRWARRHGTDVSDAVRTALRRLLDEDSRARRVEAALKRIDTLAGEGFFEPPEGEWKAGGFR